MQVEFIIAQIIILVFSVIIHEVSHGAVAEFLGDPTARLAGRLTLNPISHVDPVGSILVPILTSFAGVTFGWAKPVPYNPYNLRNKQWGEPLVAAAGPLSNLAIALVFALLIRFSSSLGIESPSFLAISSLIVLINILLAVFNSVPIPPLDGSKILAGFLPFSMRRSPVFTFLETYGFFLVLFFIIFLWEYVSPVIYTIYRLLTGTGLQ